MLAPALRISTMRCSSTTTIPQSLHPFRSLPLLLSTKSLKKITKIAANANKASHRLSTAPFCVPVHDVHSTELPMRSLRRHVAVPRAPTKRIQSHASFGHSYACCAVHQTLDCLLYCRVEGFEVFWVKILFSVAHSILLVLILQKWDMEGFSTVESF